MAEGQANGAAGAPRLRRGAFGAEPWNRGDGGATERHPPAGAAGGSTGGAADRHPPAEADRTGGGAAGDPGRDGDGSARARSAAERGGAGPPSTPGGTAAQGHRGEAAPGAGAAVGESGRPPKSRRFPRVTRDTARPEGGGRAASGDAPAPARQWPLLTVLGGTAAGLLVVTAGAVRIGIIIVGLALITGAVLRWALPEVGMLAVRSRFTDMVTYGALGFVIVMLAMMIQPDPWLDIPWLKDVVHFTVR
ncbi:DUF3017 domain-containing protein [Streptomyces sp. 7N604]|uniref:DUF3017 domain-containing protein n=1 Tax=Streptomyces sp. 7N604 TaxID=3457415 RepID=UPI003FD4C2FA